MRVYIYSPNIKRSFLLQKQKEIAVHTLFSPFLSKCSSLCRRRGSRRTAKTNLRSTKWGSEMRRKSDERKERDLGFRVSTFCETLKVFFDLSFQLDSILLKEFIPDFSVHLLQSVVAVDGSTTEPITEELSSSILLSREKRLLLLLFRGEIFLSLFFLSFC